MRILRLETQVSQWFIEVFLQRLHFILRESRQIQPTAAATMKPVKYSLRDFRQADFETVWRIDQQCFKPREFPIAASNWPNICAVHRLLPSWRNRRQGDCVEKSLPEAPAIDGWIRRRRDLGPGEWSHHHNRCASSVQKVRSRFTIASCCGRAACRSAALPFGNSGNSGGQWTALAFYKTHELQRGEDHPTILFRRRGRACSEERFAFAVRAS